MKTSTKTTTTSASAECPTASVATRTRNGKIARLPQAIREQLNRRLDDNERGKQLVEWVNSLPEAQAVFESEFGGVRGERAKPEPVEAGVYIC